MKDEDYENLLRIYDPTPGFEVRTTPMQIRNKHNPSRFRNKNSARDISILYLPHFITACGCQATHSVYVHKEGPHDYSAVCKQHLPCSSTRTLHDTHEVFS
jgi:hypothetical protein